MRRSARDPGKAELGMRLSELLRRIRKEAERFNAPPSRCSDVDEDDAWMREAEPEEGTEHGRVHEE